MGSSRTMPIDLVQAAAAFALRQGWDVNLMLARAGVSPMLLAEGRARITEEQAVSIVQSLWRSTDDELLGLSPYPMPRGSFRLICFALLGSADLREVLARLQGFLRAMPALPLSIETDEQETSIFLDGPIAELEEPLVVLTGLVAAHRLLSWLIRRDIKPTRAELATAKPLRLESLSSVFDGEMLFEAAEDRLVFASRWLDSPVMREEEDVERFIRESPRALLRSPRYGDSLPDQVRRLLEHGLRDGQMLSAEDVARRLAMSPQTLRRQLGERATSVRQISGEVRRDVAVTCLVEGRESMSDLSRRLGFSEPSAFTRAFRQWTGSTPSEYRSGVAG